MRLALAEATHRRLLLLSLESTVDELDGEVGEHVVSEVTVVLDGARRTALPRLDERTHDVGAQPFSGLTSDVLVETCPALRHGRIEQRRADGCAAGWQLVEHGHVEIAVDGECERTRDRRRRHHEHVGQHVRAAVRRGLVLERDALRHAEAVLLVDHDDAERTEAHALLDERVRADDEVDLAGCEVGEDAAPLGRARRRGQQLDAHATGCVDAERREQRGERPQVLLGQQLGRSHERRLSSAVDRGEHRPHGDERLARSHVPLQQAVHRPVTSEVVCQLRERARLRDGRGEREPCDEPCTVTGLVRTVVEADHALLESLPTPLQPELEHEQLVEHEACARGRHVVPVVGLVDRPHRRSERDQSLVVAQSGVEPVVERTDRLERSSDEGADAVARQGSGRRIDGQQTLMTEVLGGLLRAAPCAHVSEHLDLRGGELQLAAELPDLPAERGDRAGSELLRHPALVEEGHAEHRAAGLADGEVGDVAPGTPLRSEVTDLRVDDLADERGGLADLDRREVDDLTCVGVAAWVVLEQVPDRADPQRRELLRRCRTDPGQARHRLVDHRAGRRHPDLRRARPRAAARRAR